MENEYNNDSPDERRIGETKTQVLDSKSLESNFFYSTFGGEKLIDQKLIERFVQAVERIAIERRSENQEERFIKAVETIAESLKEITEFGIEIYQEEQD
jgi:hypothetical protein